jgi:hypothetical protein
MMPRATFKVIAVGKASSGTNAKGPWTLYHVNVTDVVDETDGDRLKIDRFTSFNRAWMQCVGETITSEYEIQERGEYTNYMLEAPPKPPPARMPQDGPQNGERGLDRLEVLERKVEAILSILERHFRDP